MVGQDQPGGLSKRVSACRSPDRRADTDFGFPLGFYLSPFNLEVKKGEKRLIFAEGKIPFNSSLPAGIEWTEGA
jgi:hypothetical protein